MKSTSNITFDKYDYYLIVDVEATCCNDGSIKRKDMEIIEIGAVLLREGTLEIVAEFQTFVQPFRNRKLTTFCRELTSIRQEDINSAPFFPEAITQLQNWLKDYPNYLFCSWGDYDKAQFERESAYHQLPAPFSGEHLNIKKQFSRSQELPKSYGLSGALRLAKLALTGTHHRGIDDARNMARLMPFILGNQQVT